MTTEHLGNKRGGTFLMDACGSEAQYQGCLRVTAPTHSLGDITQHYCFVGGIAFPVGETRGTPTPFTFNVEAPIMIMKSWFNRVCPFTLVVAYKTCFEGPEIAQWDDDIDFAIYFPNAKKTTEGFMGNMAQEGLDDPQEILMGTVSLSVPDWLIFEKNTPAKLIVPAELTGDITVATYCGGPLCAGLSSSCNQPYEPGCQDIWIGGAAGLLYVSTDGGNNWTDKEGVGAGELDLSDALYGTMDVLAIYCDRNVVLVSAENGCIYYSHDGGTTWVTPDDCAQMAVDFAGYMKNIFAAGDSLWKSIDDGVSWTEILEGTFVDVFFTEDGVGLAATATAIYRSTDGGVSWGELTASGLTAQTVVAEVNGRIWVAGGDGMAYSSDQGQTWTVISTDAWNDMLWLNCYIGYRLAGTANTLGPLQYTMDGGTTWWDLDITGYGREDLNVLAGCYDRLLIAGDEGFVAQLITKSRMIS